MESRVVLFVGYLFVSVICNVYILSQGNARDQCLLGKSKHLLKPIYE